MADVLSQSEIDALLSALSSGEIQPDELPKEEEKQKVKLYDFTSPQKFTKEHMRTLEHIHDSYARIISNYLTAQVRNNVKIKIESVEQITYEEFIHSVPNPTFLTIFRMPPLSGTILFETNPQFVYQILDVLLGGSGNGKYNKTREITDIDKNIIIKINKGLIDNLKLAWGDVVNVEPEIETLETNPALNQALGPHEPVALITFSTDMGMNHNFIHMCIPYLSIEKVLDKFIVQNLYQENNEEVVRESRERLRKRLDIVEVPVTAKLGATNITVEDFLRLSVGDVITLDNKCNSPIPIYIYDALHYVGAPGVIGKNMGVKILDNIDKDVENYE
ncbi:flagellar motor switch protein FliM [Clostridium hydrogenum]|uniref:flagellar motor switch protein FliM n=1 Tax=Clostridium hydrogenum TaxID=2855764 RepID=UPI001F2F2ECB|nr:flagellar motor switch protein FliM [Clostridium hydrogenum]